MTTTKRRALAGALVFFLVVFATTVALSFLAGAAGGRRAPDGLLLALFAVPLASFVGWRWFQASAAAQAATLAAYLLFHWWLILTVLTAQAAQADPAFRFPIVPLASPSAALLHLGLPFLGLAMTRLALAARQPRKPD